MDTADHENALTIIIVRLTDIPVHSSIIGGSEISNDEEGKKISTIKRQCFSNTTDYPACMPPPLLI